MQQPRHPIHPDTSRPHAIETTNFSGQLRHGNGLRWGEASVPSSGCGGGQRGVVVDGGAGTVSPTPPPKGEKCVCRTSAAAAERLPPLRRRACPAVRPSVDIYKAITTGRQGYNRPTAGGRAQSPPTLRSSHRRLPATSGKKGLAQTKKHLTFVLIQRKVSLPWCGDTVAHPLDETCSQYSTPASLGSSTRISDTRPHAAAMIIQIEMGGGGD